MIGRRFMRNLFNKNSFQFSSWIDAVIFVFSLENEPSFNSVYNFYTKMFHFRNSADIPIILVGTQGISQATIQ